jgi:ribosomal protein S18 acetylase RimI-like enzyme
MKQTKPAAVIRAFRKTDIAAALELWRITEGMSLTESDNPRTLAKFLRRNPGFSSVATLDGELVGTVLCGHDAWRGFIYHLAVAKDFRRRGIGKRLVARSLEKLRDEGLLRFSIHVLNTNPEGLDYWKRAGWKTRTDVALMQFRF